MDIFNHVVIYNSIGYISKPIRYIYNPISDINTGEKKTLSESVLSLSSDVSLI